MALYKIILYLYTVLMVSTCCQRRSSWPYI